LPDTEVERPQLGVGQDAEDLGADGNAGVVARGDDGIEGERPGLVEAQDDAVAFAGGQLSCEGGVEPDAFGAKRVG
jgi:hypothetical protein